MRKSNAATYEAALWGTNETVAVEQEDLTRVRHEQEHIPAGRDGRPGGDVVTE